jgi:large subunit ribosomal protein L4
MIARVIDGGGNSAGERALPDELFGGDINTSVMHQVVTAQLRAARSGTSSTKTRSEVSGGGSKPWRQKGTGRARQGSIRAPQWAGGGSVFGPKPRDHTLRVNKKMRKAALRGALADKTADGRIFILDGFDEPKTKAASACLERAGIDGRVLVVLDSEDATAATVDRAFRNLDRVAFSLWRSLATYDVLVADAVLFTKSAFDRYVGRER